MQVNQKSAYFRLQAQVDHTPVHTRDGTPFRADFTPESQIIFIIPQAFGLKQFTQCAFGLYVKFKKPFNDRLVFALADNGGIHAFSENCT